MKLTLYKNASDKRKLKKNITEVVAFDSGVFLKDNCSIIDPVLKISGLTSANVADINYAYISSFDRYYYVNDITFTNNNVCEMSLHVDVLGSFSKSIKNANCIFENASSSYNLYVPDSNIAIRSDETIQAYNFPNKPFSNQQMHLVLTTAGGN